MSAEPLEARLAHLEGAFMQVGERLNSIDRRLDTIEHVIQSRFGQLEHSIVSRFELVDSRFAQVESRFALIDQRLIWLIGILVGTWITTILSVLFHR